MGRGAPDFTGYKNPQLAVACPDCGARVGAWCVRPSEHKAPELHAARGAAADAAFIAQHGERASIDWTPQGWVIDPNGYARAHPEQFAETEQLELLS